MRCPAVVREKKRVVGFLFVSSSGLFFSLFEFMANENQANHTVKVGTVFSNGFYADHLKPPPSASI